jgi:Skp family chaperone for outer membrane proteins
MKTLFLAALLAAPLAALAQPAAPTQTPSMKIGYVNTERILRDAAPAVRA